KKKRSWLGSLPVAPLLFPPSLFHLISFTFPSPSYTFHQDDRLIPRSLIPVQGSCRHKAGLAYHRSPLQVYRCKHWLAIASTIHDK
ncbi:MAG: hypothetical protein J3R72DRAFT_394257, partial [Linnemannia gamsii]